jgi:hypothetical protein
MPVLTKDQIVDAVFELSDEDQAEVTMRIAERARPLHLSDEQKSIIREELAAHDRDPNDVVDWTDLKVRLQAQLPS